jgi:Ca2+-binding EF-hand superfamily protein
LEEGLQCIGFNSLGPSEISDILNHADTNLSGFIDYSELIAATVDKEKALTHENLEGEFKAFDIDMIGMISSSEVKNMLGGVDPEMCDKMIAEVDTDGNGEIDLTEFKNMMLSMMPSSPKKPRTYTIKTRRCKPI